MRNFHDELKILMDDFVFRVYEATKKFPKEELYGLTSQLRRAVLSVILNYIEGYARQRKDVLKNFIEISYGSLKETKYLLYPPTFQNTPPKGGRIYFSYRQKYLDEKEYKELIEKADKIGKMLWGVLKKL
ncbi:MAG: four helix bundle protein [Patescibacteria group bacterium]